MRNGYSVNDNLSTSPFPVILVSSSPYYVIPHLSIPGPLTLLSPSPSISLFSCSLVDLLRQG